MSKPGCLAAVLGIALAPLAVADEPGPSPEATRAAIDRVLPLLAGSAATSIEHRDCFMCHHQALPVIALDLAGRRGFAVDRPRIDEQVEHTVADLAGAADAYRQGNGQGGGVTRAGYALWTLAAGGHEPDETTDAVVAYLLKRDRDRGPWRTSSNRPPSEASDFTTTFLALRGLDAFGRAEQRDAIAARAAQARDWLLKAEPKDNEDRVFRLWALKQAGADADALRDAADDLRRGQREDGGWSQRPDDPPDAYATGSALVALHLAGGLATDDPAYRRGLAFLLRTQREDGSWHVASRSKPFQTYFESGFPHAKDQFISIAASSWAAAALALTCPDSSP